MIIIMFEENVPTTWDGLCAKINVAKTITPATQKKYYLQRQIWQSLEEYV